MPEVTASSAKLIQYLNEAYGTEKRLETALEAHIKLVTRAPYKKRLRQHLTETKRHGREVSRRIKQLGGNADGSAGDTMIEAAHTVVGGAQRAAALAQGPLHALRGTGEAEKQLKNAKTEYASEAEEIATYSAIEALAETVGDRETLTLARAIRREEERMSSFLEKEIPRLVAAVAKDEIPASERSSGRRGSSRSGRSTSTRKRTASTRTRSTGPTSRATSSSSRATGSRSGGTGARRRGTDARSS